MRSARMSDFKSAEQLFREACRKHLKMHTVHRRHIEDIFYCTFRWGDRMLVSSVVVDLSPILPGHFRR